MAIIRAPKKSKWYVVWIGRAPGIYPSWDKCRPQIEGFPNAKFRAYETLSDARTAFEAGVPRHGASKAVKAESPLPPTAKTKSGTVNNSGTKQATSAKNSKSKVTATGGPIVPSIAVDAACNMVSRVMEYRGVDIQTGKELFKMGPFAGATNNIGEFLAIVHAMGLLLKEGKSVPVYSDSNTALTWVKNRRVKTTVVQSKENKKVFELIARAEAWLEANNKTFRLLKWETDKWGENPADFGRK